MKDQSLVHEAAELFGLTPGSDDLSEGDASSTTIRCVRDGQGYYLKITSAETATSEARTEGLELFEMLAGMSTDDIRFATPSRSAQGRLVEEIVRDDRLYRASATAEARGQLLYEPESRAFAPSDVRKAGRVGGRLHRLSARLPKWRSAAEVQRSGDPVPDGETGQLKSIDLWRTESEAQVEDRDVRTILHEVDEKMRALPVSREVYGFTDLDIGFANIVSDGEVWTVIDPVPVYGWFLTCIASGTYYMVEFDTDEGRAFWRAYKEGYASEMEYDPWWNQHLELFLRHRHIILYLVVTSFAQMSPEYASRLPSGRLENMRDSIVRGESMIDFELE